MHDCRNDSANLFKLGIELVNVFDTQSAHSVLNNKKNISLNNLCSFYKLGVSNPFKEKVKVSCFFFGGIRFEGPT